VLFRSSEAPKPLDEVVSGVSANFSNAIQRAMAKDRGGRQNTAAELEKELENGLEDVGSISFDIPATIVGPAQPSHTLPTIADRPRATVDEAPGFTVLDSGVESVQPASSQASTLPTVVVSAEELAAREAAKPRQSREAIPPPAVDVSLPKKRSPLILIAAIVVVFLIVVSAGGFVLIRYLNSRGTGKTATTTTTTTDASEPLHEVGRYWIQVDTKNPDEAVRAGETVTMKSGESLKFHFSPNESGYIYLIGPGPNNAPAVFLTAQPSAASGLKTNEVRSGVDFAFPADTSSKANFLTLDQTAGTDEFTFVFSPSPITSPQFFAGPSEHLLTSEELKQWNDFQTQARANAATIEVIKTGASPRTAVKVPQNAPENASVVFGVRVEHK